MATTVTGVFIYCWGSGGGVGTQYYGMGGAAGFSSGYYSCSSETVLTYVVGSIGGGTLATGGGGLPCTNGCGGGGFSGVFTGSIAQSNAIIIAGGGGGAGLQGSFQSPPGSYGGVGGGLTGGRPGVVVSGTLTYSAYISGGTQRAGGIGSIAGSALIGANANVRSWTGGGGGGYYGGGIGPDYGSSLGDSTYIGAAGGGSGYIGRLSSSGVTTAATQITAASTASSDFIPANTASSYYSAPYGRAAQTGMVVIVPAVGTNPVYVGVTAKMLVT